MNKTAQYWIVSLLAIWLIPACGCGPEKVLEYEVSGVVTIDSEPLENGSIKFVSVDGVAPTGGANIIDGAYTAMVSPGEKKVLIQGYEVVGEEPEYQGVPDSPMMEIREMVTPEAYNAKHLTPLEANITEAQEGLNFELKKKL